MVSSNATKMAEIPKNDFDKEMNLLTCINEE